MPGVFVCICGNPDEGSAVQSFQAHTHGTQPEPGKHAPMPGLSLSVLGASSPMECRGLSVSDNAVRKELEEVSARASLTFSQELHLNRGSCPCSSSVAAMPMPGHVLHRSK